MGRHNLKVSLWERGESGHLTQSERRSLSLPIASDASILALKQLVEQRWKNGFGSEIKITEFLDGDDCNIDWEAPDVVADYWKTRDEAHANEKLYTLKVVRQPDAEEAERRQREGTLIQGGSLDFSRATVPPEELFTRNTYTTRDQGLQNPDEALLSTEGAVVPNTPVSRKRKQSADHLYRPGPPNRDSEPRFTGTQPRTRPLLYTHLLDYDRRSPKTEEPPSDHGSQSLDLAPNPSVETPQPSGDAVMADTVGEAQPMHQRPGSRSAQKLTNGFTTLDRPRSASKEALRKTSLPPSQDLWEPNSLETHEQVIKRPTALGSGATRASKANSARKPAPRKSGDPAIADHHSLVSGSRKTQTSNNDEENLGDLVGGSVTPEEMESAMSVDVQNATGFEPQKTPSRMPPPPPRPILPGSQLLQQKKLNFPTEGSPRSILRQPSRTPSEAMSSTGSNGRTSPELSRKVTFSEVSQPTANKIETAKSGADKSASNPAPKAKKSTEETGSKDSEDGEEGESESSEEDQEDDSGEYDDEDAEERDKEEKQKTSKGAPPKLPRATATKEKDKGLTNTSVTKKQEVAKSISGTPASESKAAEKATTPGSSSKIVQTPSTNTQKSDIWEEWRRKRLLAAQQGTPSGNAPAANSRTTTYPTRVELGRTPSSEKEKPSTKSSKGKTAADTKKSEAQTPAAKVAEPKSTAKKLDSKKDAIADAIPTSLAAVSKAKSTAKSTPKSTASGATSTSTSATRPARKSTAGKAQDDENTTSSDSSSDENEEEIASKQKPAKASRTPQSSVKTIQRGPKSTTQVANEMQERQRRRSKSQEGVAPETSIAEAPATAGSKTANSTKTRPGERARGAAVIGKPPNKSTLASAKSSANSKTDAEKIDSASVGQGREPGKSSDAKKIEALSQETKPSRTIPVKISKTDDAASTAPPEDVSDSDDTEDDDGSEISGTRVKDTAIQADTEAAETDGKHKDEDTTASKPNDGGSASPDSDSSTGDGDESSLEQTKTTLGKAAAKKPEEDQTTGDESEASSFQKSASVKSAVQKPEEEETSADSDSTESTESSEESEEESDNDAVSALERALPKKVSSPAAATAITALEDVEMPDAGRETSPKSSQKATKKPRALQGADGIDTELDKLPGLVEKPGVESDSESSAYDLPSLREPSPEAVRRAAQLGVGSRPSTQSRVTSQLAMENAAAFSANRNPLKSSQLDTNTPTPMPGKNGVLRGQPASTRGRNKKLSGLSHLIKNKEAAKVTKQSSNQNRGRLSKQPQRITHISSDDSSEDDSDDADSDVEEEARSQKQNKSSQGWMDMVSSSKDSIVEGAKNLWFYAR